MNKKIFPRYNIAWLQLKVAVFILLLVFRIISGKEALGQNAGILKIQSHEKFIFPSAVSINGILGQAIKSCETGRLLSLPDWNNGELIKIFSPEARNNNKDLDWYGEHAGKWMYTTALAANRTGNDELKTLLLKTVNYLISTQQKDGYLGTYSAGQRITNGKPEYHKYSWDVWNLSYMILGLLKVNYYFPNEKYLEAARKTGELFLKTFEKDSLDIIACGTRKGMSATVILDPVVELYKQTKDIRYLNLALNIIKKIDEKDGPHIIPSSIKKMDMEKVGDGKAYQLIWNLTAIAKLYQVTGNPDYLKAVENAWHNIVENHLSAAGGPWGGIGKHHECFNQIGYWSPYGFVETCSTMAWIQLNSELLQYSGEAKYAQEIEKSTYNALLGAQYPNGQAWCYHSFDNGCRHEAHFYDCCSSSGPMALEELSSLIYSLKDNGIACNIYTESEASISLSESNSIRIIQKTKYPFAGDIQITLLSSKQSNFPFFVRIPDWAKTVSIKINGKSIDTSKMKSGTFFSIEHFWKTKDVIDIEFPFELRIMKKLEYADAPQGGPDIYHVNWFAIAKGPLVYATNGLIDGKDRERIFLIPEKEPETYFVPATTPNGYQGMAYELKIPNQKPLLFLPYYEAGGRKPGTWRLTWIQNKIGY